MHAAPPATVDGHGVVNAVIDCMTVEKKDERPDPEADPSPYAPGVWVTEATGFACVPPRAQSDLSTVRNASKVEHDDHATDPECDTKLPSDDVEPRIERYRER
jgi:hypothetical protein